LAGLQALQVLVIDDNAQMRTIIGTVLLAAGIRHIHYAPNGRVGLERLREGDVDVVYVDHEMPVMNGVDFVRAVRRGSGERRFLPVIMLTGHSARHHICAARDAGVSEFLGKPVSARSILQRLEAVILRPRPFVVSASYIGPDRRRRIPENYAGPFRRASDSGRTLEL